MTQPKPNNNSTAGYQKLFYCLFFAIILFAAQVRVLAQQDSSTVPSVIITKFSFKLLTGGVIIVKATVGNKPDSLNFVLDTGSGGISLDSSTVDYLQFQSVESERTIRGIAGIRKVKYVRNLALHLPGLDVENLDFHINDYEILTNVYGVRIDGIIGYSFLSRYIMKIDYDVNMLEVWKMGIIKYPRQGYLMKPAISSIPIVNATIKDALSIDGSFYFDTGAGLCLLLSQDFATDKGVIKKGRKMTLTQAEGLGGKKTMFVTIVKQVKFGPFKFRKVPTHIFKDEFNVTSYPVLGGLIGNDLFRRFNMVLNYSKKEIHLLPNSHYEEPFDYSYTGMGIYFINGDILVEDVLAGSPAEKAGLKIGDRILAVDKNFTNNIQVYKNMLQNPGSRLNLIVIRDGIPITISLKVKSIL